MRFFKYKDQVKFTAKAPPTTIDEQSFFIAGKKVTAEQYYNALLLSDELDEPLDYSMTTKRSDVEGITEINQSEFLS